MALNEFLKTGSKLTNSFELVTSDERRASLQEIYVIFFAKFKCQRYTRNVFIFMKIYVLMMTIS